MNKCKHLGSVLTWKECSVKLLEKKVNLMLQMNNVLYEFMLVSTDIVSASDVSHKDHPDFLQFAYVAGQRFWLHKRSAGLAGAPG